MSNHFFHEDSAAAKGEIVRALVLATRSLHQVEAPRVLPVAMMKAVTLLESVEEGARLCGKVVRVRVHAPGSPYPVLFDPKHMVAVLQQTLAEAPGLLEFRGERTMAANDPLLKELATETHVQYEARMKGHQPGRRNHRSFWTAMDDALADSRGALLFVNTRDGFVNACSMGDFATVRPLEIALGR